jgi:phage antirepressor YoqD-like protein
MMAPNTSVKSLDKAVEFSMTRMDLFMMENGLMIRSQVMEKCSTLMVQSMMDNGSLTKFMGKASSSQATGIGMRATLTSASVKGFGSMFYRNGNTYQG